MNKAWKVFAAAATAVALVAAPLSMASAEELPPDVVVEEVVTEEVAAPGEDIPAVVEEPVVEEAVVETPVAEVITPAEEEIVPEAETEVEPVVEEAVAEPEQGYVLVLWKADSEGTEWPQSLVSSIKTTSTSLDSLDYLATEDCTFYQVDLYADDATTTALIAGGVLTGPNNPAESFPDIYGPKWKQWTTTCPPPTDDVPPVITIVPDCDNEAGNILVTVQSDNDVTVPVTLYLDFNGDLVPDASEVLQVVPGETILHYTFAEDVVVGIVVQFEGETIFADLISANCQPDVYPVPAQFNAEPEPAGCDFDGTFATEFLGEPISDDGEGTTEYVFENVDVNVTRTDTGVFLTIQAHEGYVLEGLDEEKWDVSGDGLFAERFITLDTATGFQDDDPEAPCFLAPGDVPTTLTPPTVTDECGTDNDSVTLPENTDSVEYRWQDETDPNNFNVEAVVAAGFVVETVPDGWVEIDTNAFRFDVVDPFTDEACEVTPPVVVPPGPASVPPITPAALAATGMENAPLPLLWGSMSMLLVGAAALIWRRVVRS